MAKSNKVILCGIVKKPPIINEEGDYGSLILKTTIGSRYDGENKKYKYVYNIVMSRDPAIITRMAELNAFDLIYIKGVIVTRNVTKIHTCKGCKSEISEKGQVVYVEPIFLEKINSPGEENAQKELNNHEEISNEVTIVGRACTEPHKVPANKKSKESSKYHIAITRTYRLKNSTEEEKTDYPIIHAFGDNAKMDLENVHKSTMVVIDGYIQAYEKEVPCKCPNCGLEHKWKDHRMEIIPYETEYVIRTEKSDREEDKEEYFDDIEHAETLIR